MAHDAQVSPGELLDGHAVRNCPVRLQQRALGIPEDHGSEAASKWRDAAVLHRHDVAHGLQAVFGDAVVVVDRQRLVDARRQTAAAVEDPNCALIVNAALPEDPRGRRRGWADLLVRSGTGFVPVVVKHHKVVEAKPQGRTLAGTLASPFLGEATWERGQAVVRGAQADGLELVHLWHLLDAAGWLDDGALPIGGVVDARERLWWLPLDEQRWGPRRQSLLERYVKEFALRVAVADRAEAHRGDPAVELLVQPLRKQECERCSFATACGEEMAANDSLSLLSGMQWRHALAHSRVGIRTRADLAELDPASAAVAKAHRIAGGAEDLGALLHRAAAADPATPVGNLVGEDLATRRVLRHLGMQTAADLARLDLRTLELPTVALGALPEEIERARAHVTGRAYRRGGVEAVVVPRGTIEVDLDMERSVEGVYLWGMVVTADEVDEGYTAVVSFDPLSPHGEVNLVRQMLDHLDALAARALEAGGSLRVYAYSNAEADELRRISGHSGDAQLERQVARLVGSQAWVDLRVVVERHLVVGHGVGLKKMATHFGFTWRDEDPSGLESMAWYDRAVTGETDALRMANRERLLAYNEDDCRATLALRRWLDAAELPSIEDWEPASEG